MLDNSKAIEVLNAVKELEKEWGSKENRTLSDIEEYYDDAYILSIWETEDASRNDGEGFETFEGFLIDFIGHYLQFDEP